MNVSLRRKRAGLEVSAGKQWKAKFQRRVIERHGREPNEKFILLNLNEVHGAPRP